MPYQFKFGSEAVWAVLVAGVTALAQVTQGAPPTDWKVWLVAAAAAVTRAVLGAVFSATIGPSNPS